MRSVFAAAACVLILAAPATSQPPRTIQQRVAEIKRDLRPGMDANQLGNVVRSPIDKLDMLADGQYSPEFNFTAVRDDMIVRFFPFEVPGSETPRYRVNVYFGSFKNGNRGVITYYFRAP